MVDRALTAYTLAECAAVVWATVMLPLNLEEPQSEPQGDKESYKQLKTEVLVLSLRGTGRIPEQSLS